LFYLKNAFYNLKLQGYLPTLIVFFTSFITNINFLFFVRQYKTNFILFFFSFFLIFISVIHIFHNFKINFHFQFRKRAQKGRNNMTIAPQPNKKLKATGSKEGERDRKRPRHNPATQHSHEQSIRSKNARTQGPQSKV